MVHCVQLTSRAQITVSGADRYDFLQGLVTQDVFLLKSNPLIYACLLTPNGKFLFDFFIRAQGDALLIDCEGAKRATALLNRLSMFKLRSDVTLDLQDNINVFQTFNGRSDGYRDPRFEGYRHYSKPENIDEVDFSTWDTYRIHHEIPDGSRDLIPEKSFIHESAMIIETAVSYTKGCYMGQELTARMHHRNLGKKHLRAIEFTNEIPPEALSDLSVNGKLIGQMRSSCKGSNIGLAMIRDDKLEELKNDTGSIRLLG